MRIGELARLAGVNIQTIRFYEREGLLRAPERSAGGYRCYTGQDLRSVRNIRAWQAIGFTLKDVRDLSDYQMILTTDGLQGDLTSSAGSQILRRAEERLSGLNAQLQALQRMKADMEQFIAALAAPAVNPDRVALHQFVGVSG